MARPVSPRRAPRAAPGRPAPGFGVAGVHVATDYIGLGPIGERHPYLSGPSEAHSVIDGVRAATRLAGSGAGTRWTAVGHSQGGHAALFTNELGQEYAPELELLGTVAIAPAAVLGRTFGPDDQIVPRMVGVMALYGFAADDPDIVVEDYVGEQVAAADDVIDTGCLDDVVRALVGIPGDTFYARDPLTTEPAAAAFRSNDPGHVAVGAPLLLVSGTADVEVVPARVDHLFGQLCEVGQRTELQMVDGAGHGSVVPRLGGDGDRLADRPLRRRATEGFLRSTGEREMNQPADPAPPRIPPVDRADATERQAELLDALGPAGDMNIFRTLAQHPKLMRSWLPFGGRLLQGSSLPETDRELVILRAAARCGSDYEWGQHVSIARDAGLSDDQIRAAGDLRRRPCCRAGTARSCGPPTSWWWTTACRTRAGPRWRSATTPTQLLELAMLAGHYAMLAGVLRSAGVRSEGPLPPVGQVELHGDV